MPLECSERDSKMACGWQRYRKTSETRLQGLTQAQAVSALNPGAPTSLLPFNFFDTKTPNFPGGRRDVCYTLMYDSSHHSVIRVTALTTSPR